MYCPCDGFGGVGNLRLCNRDELVEATSREQTNASDLNVEINENSPEVFLVENAACDEVLQPGAQVGGTQVINNIDLVLPIVAKHPAPTDTLVNGDVSSCRASFDFVPEVTDSLNEQVRSVIAQVLIKPISGNGYPLSVIVGENNIAIKKALMGMDGSSNKVLVKTFFGKPDGGHTHRRCAIKCFEGRFDVVRDCVTPAGRMDIVESPSRWQRIARHDALEEGIILKPGTLLFHILLGPSVAEESAAHKSKSSTTDARMHLLALSNPLNLQANLNVLQCCIRLVHSWSATLRLGAGRTFTEAFFTNMPETREVLQCLFKASDWACEAVKSVSGVLRHNITFQCDFTAVEKRWGHAAKLDLQRSRPAHQVVYWEGGSEEGTCRFLKFVEDSGSIEVMFFTNVDGHFVYMGEDGDPAMQDGKVIEVPSLLSGEIFRIRVTETKMQLLGCGCFFSTMDAPDMLLAIQGRQDPRPILRIWCLEVSPFPMEWFYRPLLDATQLRYLLTKEFQMEFHFEGDELHWIMNLQMPKPSAVLNKFAQTVFGIAIRNVSSPIEEDIAITLQTALGKDFLNLEEHLKLGMLEAEVEPLESTCPQREVSDTSVKSKRSNWSIVSGDKVMNMLDLEKGGNPPVVADNVGVNAAKKPPVRRCQCCRRRRIT